MHRSSFFLRISHTNRGADMKRVQSVRVVATVVLFLCCVPLYANNSLIYAIDVSKSMRQPPGFFNSLKTEIKEYIRGNVEPGDKVTIYAFGDDVRIVSDVPNFEVKGAQDIERLMGFVDALQPNDNKTWLSKAIDNVAMLMSSTQNQYPNTFIRAFLFTDGKNDPPSGVSSLSVQQILGMHRAVFENPSTHTYIITLNTTIKVTDNDGKVVEGITVISDTKDIERKKVIFGPARVSATTSPSMTSEVSAEFDKLSMTVGRVMLEFSAGGSSEIKALHVQVPIESTTTLFRVPIKLSDKPKPGTYKLVYNVKATEPSVAVQPSSVTIDLTIEKAEIRILSSDLQLKATTEGGGIPFSVKGQNMSPDRAATLSVRTEPADPNIVLPRESFTVSPGEFEKELTIEVKAKPKGQYSYVLFFDPSGDQFTVNKSLSIGLVVEEPFDWGPLLTVLIALLAVCLVVGGLVGFLYLVHKKFGEFTLSGFGLKKVPLNQLKKFHQLSIVIGTDVFKPEIGQQVVTIRGGIYTVTKGELRLVWHDMEKTLPKNPPSKLEPMQVRFDGKHTFEISRNETTT